MKLTFPTRLYSYVITKPASRGSLLFLIALFVLAGCGSGQTTSTPSASAGADKAAALTVTSPAFVQGAAIPALYSCQGEDRSPALAWDQSPVGTQSLALLMEDPDAPGGTWTHWVVYNLPPGVLGLPEGASSAKGEPVLPAEAAQGQNSFRRANYGGPCPPSGTHRYYFKLYALDIKLSGDLNRAALLKAMDGHILASGELMGTFAK